LFRNVIFLKNCFNGTFRNARFAIDAFVRVNYQNRFAFVEAFYGTYNNAVCVLAVEAGFSDDMSHFDTFQIVSEQRTHTGDVRICNVSGKTESENPTLPFYHGFYAILVDIFQASFIIKTLLVELRQDLDADSAEKTPWICRISVIRLSPFGATEWKSRYVVPVSPTNSC